MPVPRHPAEAAYKEKQMAKVIDLGSAKPDDPIYSTGPVIGGVRFYNPPRDPVQEKQGDQGNSLREAIAAITPEQSAENERTMARRRDEAVARGQHPMQPYADDVEEAIMKSIQIYLDDKG
jgi:hypothetical protein